MFSTTNTELQSKLRTGTVPGVAVEGHRAHLASERLSPGERAVEERAREMYPDV